MATQGQVTKIYELRTLGYSDISKQLDDINKKFEAIKRTKLSAQGNLFASQDIADIKKYADELAKLTVQEKQLSIEKARLVNEQKAAQVVRQQEIDQRRREREGVVAAAGSYKALYNEYRELYKLVQNTPKGSPVDFRGQTLGFDEAIAKLQQLAAAEQDFRRQFQRDGLLVGEYTSGIVQAFKKLGLDDLIGGQITKANQKLESLNQEFNQLQQELSETKVTGQGALEVIEKQLIDNRKEAIALTQQVGALEKEFRGTGDIGNQITKSISEGFNSLKGQVTSFALQYIGFQAAFNKITNEVSEGIADAKQIEGVEAAFTRLNNPNLLANLRAATRGTVSDLELMKQAVQASNFQIPVEQLGTLLDFARRRAKETGQEVDYLVQSIITGIGRKSPLILDNLGISAVRLRQSLKGISEETATVGDVAAAVGKIIQEENAKAGAEVDTTSEKVAQNEAKWKNIRVELASNLIPALVTVGSLFLALIANLPTLLAILGVLAAGWAFQNAELVTLNGQMLLYNARILLNYAALGILSAASVAYNAVLLVLNGTVRVVTAGLRLFGITLTAGAGPLGVVLALVGLLGAALLGLSKAFGSQISLIQRSNRELELMRQITSRANQAISDQIGKVQSLAKVVQDSNVSLEGRKQALQELIEVDKDYLKGLSLQNISTEEGIAIINNYIESLREKARIEAAYAVRNEKLREDTRLQTIQIGLERKISTGQAKDLEDLTDEEKAFIGNARKQFAFTASVVDLATGTSAAQEALDAIKSQRGKLESELLVTDELIKKEFDKQGKAIAEGPTIPPEVDIEKLKAEIEALDKQIDKFKGSNADLQKLIAQRKKLQDELDRLLGKQQDQRKGKIENSDPFRIIDSQRDKLLADEEKRRLRDEESESQYLKNILAINQAAIDKKLAILKGKNAEELKLRSQLQLERVKLETDTQKKLEEIAQKQFDAIVKDLQQQRDESIRNAKAALQVVLDTPGATETQKAQVRLDADKAILKAQETFGNQLDLLEKQVGLQSIQNVKDTAEAVKRVKQEIATDQLQITEANLQDIEAVGVKSVAEFRAQISAARLKNTNSNASPTRKEQVSKNLDREENIGVLAREVANAKILLPIYEALLATKQITDEKYFKFIENLNNKQAELANALETTAESALSKIPDIKSALTVGIGDLFNVKSTSAEGKALAQGIAETYSFAMDAMNGYFDAERERIQDSLKLAEERLDIEKEQLLAKAQSKAEEESIEKQFAARKKKLEQDAFEKTKDTKKKEAKIAFLMEIANIWSTVWSIGNPIVAAILGAVLTGLAVARYANTVSSINQQKFAFGGEVPTRGGTFGGRPHSEGGTPFTFKGQQYEAEVDELSIIRTKNAPRDRVFTITGNQKQIASKLNEIGGGISFAPGARMKKFAYGGNLGESLQPPVFVPSAASNTVITNSGITKEDLDVLYGKMDNLAAEQSRRIDRMEVVQVTSSVTAAQKKQVKQSEIGTL